MLFSWQRGIRANLCHAQVAFLWATQAGIKTLKMYGAKNRSTGTVGRRKRPHNLMTLYLTSGLTDEADPPFQSGLKESFL